MSTANTAAFTKLVSKHCLVIRQKYCDRKLLTNNDKRQICPVEQVGPLLRTNQLLSHVPQLSAARRRSHKRQTPKRESCELPGAGKLRRARETEHEKRSERELRKQLDPEKRGEPRLVLRGAGEEGVARRGDVGAAQGDEEVQWSCGSFPEGRRVE